MRIEAFEKRIGKVDRDTDKDREMTGSTSCAEALEKDNENLRG